LIIHLTSPCKILVSGKKRIVLDLFRLNFVYYVITLIEILQTIVCAQCGLCIIYNNDDDVVDYSSRNVEPDDCYFDHHPHNVICLICGGRSNFLAFKYIEQIVLSSFQELVMLIIFQ